MVELLAISLAVISTIVATFGFVFLKLGTKKITNVKEFIFNIRLIIGIIFFLISTVFMVSALKLGNLSEIFPVTSLTYIWVALSSWKFLKERMTIKKIVAFGLIVIGVIFVTM